MGFTDSHDSMEEDVSFQAPSDGDLFIAVRAYQNGHNEKMTFTLNTFCDDEKQICRDAWSAIDQADHSPHVKTEK